jgi:translocation and assembly module TamB
MRPVKLVWFSLVLLFALGGVGECSLLPDITNFGGSSVLSLIQSQVNGTVSAQKISGNPVTGVVLQDFSITGPDGKTVVVADRFVVRLSLSSIPNFHLDLATVALDKPRIYVFQENSGQWNVSQILKPQAKPAKPPGLVDNIIKYFLRKIQIANLVIKDGEIQVTKNGKTTQYPNLDLQASLTLLRLGQPQEQIKLNLASLGIGTPMGRAELASRLAYSGGLAKIDFLNLKLGGQTVASVKGEVCRPLTGLTCTLTGKIGPLAGDKIQGFWPQWPAPWDMSGALSLSSTPDGGQVRVQGKIGQAEYAIAGDLNGKVKPVVFKLDLDLKGLTTAQLKEIKEVKAQQIQGLGPVNAHLHVEGAGLPWEPQSLKTNLELAPFRYKDLKVEKARFDLSGNAQKQELRAAVAGNFGTADLSATGHLLPLGKVGGVHGDLTVQTGDLKPGMLGVADLAGSALTTCFTGKFRLPPGLSRTQLYLAGDLEASGLVKHEPVKSLQASFVLEGRKLTIAAAEVQAAGIAASLQGTVTESGLDVTLAAQTSGSRALPLPPGSGFSSLQVQGSVRGSWKSPRINLTGQAARVSFAGNKLQSVALSADLSGLPPQSGAIQFHGAHLQTKAGDFAQITLEARGTGGQWQFQMAAASPKEPKFELAGTADLTRRPLDFHIQKLSWQSRNLTCKNQAPFQVRLFPGYEVSAAMFQVDGGTVGLQLLARGGELAGKVQVKNLDAGRLAPLGLAATGKFNGQATLAGSPAAPIITAQLALSGGQVKNIPVQTLTTTLNYQSGEMQVAGYLQAGPQNSRLIWKGAAPVTLSLAPFKFALAESGLDLKVQSQDINLSLLTLFTKEVEEAESKVEAVVEVKGNPHSPKVTGYIRWAAGRLLVRQAGTPFTLDAGEIRLQGDKIAIPEIAINSRGTARFSGEISLAGGGRVRATARLDDFLALNRGGNNLIASGLIDLGGPLNALVAKGHLMVPTANFRPTFFQTGRNPDIVLVSQKGAPKGKKAAVPNIYKNMAIDVSVEAPGGVWLKDPMGQVELTANLKIKKAPDRELALGGEIRSLHGTLEVEGKEFKVERAILTLPGAPHKPIMVDAKASRPMEDADITIVVMVNGTLTNPQIHLESLPPLPPTDVLSYLVFGAPAATLSRDQYLAFAAQYGLLGGGGGNKLGEILGSTIPFLSGIKVKTGMVSGRPTVGVEKKLMKNVSVFVSRNLNEERGVYENQAGIQYKINRNLSVESQVGTRNSGADVFFNYDF